MSTSKILKGLFSLDHNIRIYIPGTDTVNQKIDNTVYVVMAQKYFSDWFGGATSYDAIGAWNSQQKGLILEGVKIVEAYGTREQVEKHLQKVIEYAQKIKAELHQEAVSLEYDNKLYFI